MVAAEPSTKGDEKAGGEKADAAAVEGGTDEEANKCGAKPCSNAAATKEAHGGAATRDALPRAAAVTAESTAAAPVAHGRTGRNWRQSNSKPADGGCAHIPAPAPTSMSKWLSLPPPLGDAFGGGFVGGKPGRWCHAGWW